ncbi:butyrophilin subfamily 3 member A2-like [Serinus canaria]|uniref:butyrophilin subfamily 3 member A2-like n=1 Tax=Serinus canaria TaxID=9135 RepID=UPI0021CCB292|nr:butyrophilin subfamily 3 member A2-like [Serinus canaria]
MVRAAQDSLAETNAPGTIHLANRPAQPPAGAQAEHNQPGPRSQPAEAAPLAQTLPPCLWSSGNRGTRQLLPFPGSCPSLPPKMLPGLGGFVCLGWGSACSVGEEPPKPSQDIKIPTGRPNTPPDPHEKVHTYEKVHPHLCCRQINYFLFLYYYYLLCIITGGFLSAPRTPVLGIIGDKVVLPCQVGSTPIPEDFSIRWTFHLGQSRRIPVGSSDGKGRREEPDQRYRGRAELFHGEFRAGNASLLLRDVRSSDQGSYSCQVSFQDESREVLVELEVAAVGSAPSVTLRGRQGEALALSCLSSGWFPLPELLWLDGLGRSRPEPAATAATVGPGGLFSVRGSVRIRPGSGLEISCRVLNRRLGAARASRLRIHGAEKSGNSRLGFGDFWGSRLQFDANLIYDRLIDDFDMAAPV